MADEALGKILGSGRDLGGGVSGARSAWRRGGGLRCGLCPAESCSRSPDLAQALLALHFAGGCGILASEARRPVRCPPADPLAPGGLALHILR